MTAPTPAEQAVIQRFEAAPAAEESLFERVRMAIDDGVLMHTGRSVGDIASGRVAAEVLAVVRGEQS